jgi:Family of unknown function (DUF6459)
MTSRPNLLGDLRSPAPQAAMLARGAEPPGTPAIAATGPGFGPAPELASEGSGCPNTPGGRRPLPDPVAVQLCRIPDPAPPYDGDAAPGTADSTPAGRKKAGPSVVPFPGEPATFPGWPSRFAQVLAETLAGSRPPGQMVPWTTEMARIHIRRLGPYLASVQQPRVRRVVTFHPSSDVMEMTVVVGFGPRVRALAVRLERTDHPGLRHGRQPEPRWLCTAVEAG